MRLRACSILAPVAPCALALALVGCTSSWRPPQARPTALPSQGHSSELVLSAPAALDQDPWGDPDFDRRDAALAVPQGSSRLQALAYPGEPAPDLLEQRWIHLRRTSDQFIYFDRYPRYQWDHWPRHPHNWGW